MVGGYSVVADTQWFFYVTYSQFEIPMIKPTVDKTNDVML